MNRKQFKRKMRALNKVAARNLKSPEATRQFLQSAGIVLRDQSEKAGWMNIISTSSGNDWMIIASGSWD